MMYVVCGYNWIIKFLYLSKILLARWLAENTLLLCSFFFNARVVDVQANSKITYPKNTQGGILVNFTSILFSQ